MNETLEFCYTLFFFSVMVGTVAIGACIIYLAISCIRSLFRRGNRR